MMAESPIRRAEPVGLSGQHHNHSDLRPSARSTCLTAIDENGNITDDAEAKVNTVLHQTFRPEFLNRLDEICVR